MNLISEVNQRNAHILESANPEADMLTSVVKI